MNKELFKEFVDYCDSKPKDEAINHDSWSSCAVGEFFKFKGISEVYCGSPEITNLLGDHCFEDDIELNPLAYEISVANRFGRYKTYQDFTELLKKYL